MARTTTRTIRQWTTWIIALAFVTSLGVWFLGRETLPGTIRVATGAQGGLYYRLGSALKSPLSDRTHRPVDIEPTDGSVENLRKLLAGEVHLAVLQGGSVPMDDVAVVTPLFPELVLMIVRKESGIERMADLAGRNVSLGPPGSGNRQSALRVLGHFGVDPAGLGHNERYFGRWMDEPTLDAAIVTVGIGHPDLVAAISSNEFELLPIADAEAVGMLQPFLRSTGVPRGLLGERPAVPAQPLRTVAATAYLVARVDAPDSLVAAALAAVHEESLRLAIPTLIPRQDASSRVPTRLHPVAQRYFNPSDNLGFMSNVLSSLAATKELLFAVGAGIYLLWLRWRGLKRREAQEIMSRQKEQLDRLLEKTLRIEEAQLRTTGAEELRALLDAVTRIKLRALQEFTEEELRGDQAFSIFLMQCANLINEIQLKIITQGSDSPGE